MSSYWIGLLLPIAYLYGWWIGHRNHDAKGGSRFASKSDYFKGLNYVLNEEPDKAIEVFLHMLEVDQDTVETHLALGNLFRRRGEADRAIRIHQNLIARPTLTTEQRSLALLELGRDYMAAGVLDRAENLFLELAESGEQTKFALDYLRQIFQQEKEWDKAIEIGNKIESKSNKAMSGIIAQYHCERAELAWRQKDFRLADRMLSQALSHDRQCARANILKGKIAQQSGDYKTAIRAYLQVEQQNIEYVPEMLDSLDQCYQATGDASSMKQYLRKVMEKYAGVSPVIMLSKIIQTENGDQAALEFLSEQLRKRPSLRGLEQYLVLEIRNAAVGQLAELTALQDTIQALLKSRPKYLCEQCGFKGRTMHWNCPSCKQWNTVKPIQGLEGVC